MVAVDRGNNMVEVRSKSGEVIVIDQSGYEMARSLLELVERTSPRVLRVAAERWAADPEEKTESQFLADFIEMYLERIQA